MAKKTEPLRFDNVDHALFSGIEQEGPLKGLRTLFVVGDVPYEKIEEELRKSHKTKYQPLYEAIYFGAGFRSQINFETMKAVHNILGNQKHLFKHLTFETTKNIIGWFRFTNKAQAWCSCNWMLPIVWQGQIDEEGMTVWKQIASSMKKKLASYPYHVFVKIDADKSTTVARAHDSNFSSYADYSGDKIIYQQEKR